MDDTKLKIVIADDHPLFRNALQQALNNHIKAEWLEADNASSLDELIGAHSVDLVLLDLDMPGSHGHSTLIHLRTHFPAVPVVVISAHEDDVTISKTLSFDCQGFIPKSSAPTEFAAAINQVLEGDTYIPSHIDATALSARGENIGNRLAELTPQQYRVLQMFAEGLLNKQIAYELDVSEATIKAHATAIFRKLDVRNRTQAVIALQELEVTKKSL